MKARDEFDSFMQALADSAPITKPGDKPKYDPKLIEAMRAKAESGAAELNRVAASTPDKTLASEIGALSKAIAGYADIADLSTTDTQGTELVQTFNRAAKICAPAVSAS